MYKTTKSLFRKEYLILYTTAVGVLDHFDNLKSFAKTLTAVANLPKNRNEDIIGLVEGLLVLTLERDIYKS